MPHNETARYGDAAAVNPEAGTHAVTADPREQRAARRAAGRTWKAFPYYARRYGSRGQKFSLSDSGWLATLCDLPPDEAAHQVRWLGRVLSSRGMPQWLLEQHLEALHEELVAAVPEGAARYAVLLHGAAVLRAGREAALPPDELRRIADEFDARVGPVWSRRLRGMGGIVAAAAADERAGVGMAVPVLLEWACDPERFPPEWIEAVNAALERARAAAA
jgi:hypothetical protein